MSLSFSLVPTDAKTLAVDPPALQRTPSFVNVLSHSATTSIIWMYKMTSFLALFFFFWLYTFTVLLVSVTSSDPSNTNGVTATTESCVEESCTSNDLAAIATTTTTTTTTTKTTLEGHGDEECGIWLALSTLPGTGIGMFAGKRFVKQEIFMAGDHIVPIIDFVNYQRNEDEPFLWSEYTWVSKSDLLTF